MAETPSEALPTPDDIIDLEPGSGIELVEDDLDKVAGGAIAGSADLQGRRPIGKIP